MVKIQQFSLVLAWFREASLEEGERAAHEPRSERRTHEKERAEVDEQPREREGGQQAQTEKVVPAMTDLATRPVHATESS